MKLNLKSLLGANFGKINDNRIVFTMNGVGVRTTEGGIAVLNKDTKEITILPAELAFGDIPAFSLPVKPDAIAVGDMIYQNGSYQFVTGKADDGVLTVIDYATQHQNTVMPTKTLMGFSAVSKVVNIFEDLFKGFGKADGAGMDMKSMLPLMLLSDEGGLGDMFGGDDDGLGGILPLMMLSGGGLGNLFGGAAADGKDNPLAAILPLMLLKNL